MYETIILHIAALQKTFNFQALNFMEDISWVVIFFTIVNVERFTVVVNDI